jgi:hypothetical protein
MAAEEIDVSMGGAKILFKPSEQALSAHLDGWTLYDVYVEDEHVGLVADTGIDEDYGFHYRIWKPLEGNTDSRLDALNQDEAAASFFRPYYDEKKRRENETK